MSMDAYNYLKEEILKINQDILSLISKAKSMTGLAETSFGDWEKTCQGLPDQMAEDIMRVAVVGPIKSGKSTFLRKWNRHWFCSLHWIGARIIRISTSEAKMNAIKFNRL